MGKKSTQVNAYDYDKAGHVIEIDDCSTNKQLHAYSYNSMGQKDEECSGPPNFDIHRIFLYDTFGNEIQASRYDYTYDRYGNWVTDTVLFNNETRVKAARYC